MGIGGKIGTSLFLSFFALMGIGFSVVVIRDWIQTLRTHSWPTVECRILSSAVTESADRENPYGFAVEFAYVYPAAGAGYEAQGREYRSKTYMAKSVSSSDYSEMGRLVARHPAGGLATCRVDPVQPQEAVLELQSLWSGLVVLLPLIFICIGVGGIIGVWKSGGRQGRSAGLARRESISVKATGSRGRWILVAFFGIFFAAGAGMLWPLGVRPVLKVMQARSWPAVPCTIVSSRVLEHCGDDGSTYSVDILYSYTMAGREFRSNRYTFMGGSSSGHEGKRAVVDAHPPGRRSNCFVNPADASEAVLEREFSGIMFLGIVPLLFLLVGLVGMLSQVRGIRGGAGSTPSRLPDGSLGVWLGRGPMQLKARGGSPLAKLVGVTFIALFWNGIVSIFVWQAVSSWLRKEPEWFLTIFMIPFVLIGLALIGGIFYQFLALFSPRSRLVLESHPIELGRKVALRWEISGAVSRIGLMEITLEGREEATYQRGTTTTTDKSVFYSARVFETRDVRQMAAGRASVAIPADTMHSLEAPHNKIVWVLRLHGDIARWPDVKDEFDLQVQPVGEEGRV